MPWSACSEKNKRSPTTQSLNALANSIFGQPHICLKQGSKTKLRSYLRHKIGFQNLGLDWLIWPIFELAPQLSGAPVHHGVRVFLVPCNSANATQRTKSRRDVTDDRRPPHGMLKIERSLLSKRCSEVEITPKEGGSYNFNYLYKVQQLAFGLVAFVAPRGVRKACGAQTEEGSLVLIITNTSGCQCEIYSLFTYHTSLRSPLKMWNLSPVKFSRSR